MPQLSTRFAVAVDLVVLTVRAGTLAVLVTRRDTEPFTGRVALPGRLVTETEDLPIAAARCLADHTGLAPDRAHLEQLASYGTPDRDPRGRVVAVAYLALLPSADIPQATGWQAAEGLLDRPEALAFDHHAILTDGVERARSKLEYSSLAAEFCPPEFTIAQLRRVYQAVWGAPVDPRNFHRKVTGTEGFVIATDHHTGGDRGRPARLYRRGPADSLHPPLLRP